MLSVVKWKLISISSRSQLWNVATLIPCGRSLVSMEGSELESSTYDGAVAGEGLYSVAKSSRLFEIVSSCFFHYTHPPRFPPLGIQLNERRRVGRRCNRKFPHSTTTF